MGGRVATVKAIIGGTVEVAAEEAMEGVIVEEEGEVAVVETIRAMGGKANNDGGGGGGKTPTGKCTLCNKWHRMPFDDYCHSLEKNKHLKEAYDKQKGKK